MSMDSPDALRHWANVPRYRNQKGGFYESFFLRGNHPTQPRGFWIRYTVFSPHGSPSAAEGELWFLWFDKRNGHEGRKEVFPLDTCAFGNPLSSTIQIGNASLGKDRFRGGLENGVSWDLNFTCAAQPLLLLPKLLYSSPLPKAKALVPAPLALFSGSIHLANGTEIEVDGWQGSQNHNWGTRHTDEYCWGQVAGFDGHSDSFLEVASATIKLGKKALPQLTPLVLRHKGRTFALNSIPQTLRAEGTLSDISADSAVRWNFETESGPVHIRGFFESERRDFLVLPYRNPPGGVKHCLNSKIARAEVTLTEGGNKTLLNAEHRAAFEILTDRRDHGFELAV